MDEKVYKGVWWILGQDEQQYGRLDLSASGKWTLETLTQIDSNSDRMRASTDSFVDIIQGFANARKVTLFRCGRIDIGERLSEFGEPTHVMQTFRVETVLIGEYFDSYEEIKFKEVRVRFSDMNQWIGYEIQASSPVNNTINLKFPEKELAEVFLSPHKVSVKLLAPEKIVSSLKEIRIGLNPLFKLEFARWATYEELKFLIRGLQRFLGFAMRTAVTPLRTYANVITDKEVEIYSNYDMPVNRGIYHIYDGLFLFSEVEDFFQDCVALWFEKLEVEAMEPVVTLLQLSKFYPAIPYETTFLNLAQAAETYHRERRKSRGENKGRYQSDNKWQKGIYKKLMNALPDKLLEDSSNESEEDFRDAVEDSLRYANNYSLITRLEDLLHEVRKIVPEGFLKDGDEIKKTAEDIKKIRNYYTHFSGDEDTKRKAKDAIVISKLSRRLELALETLLLRDIGIPAKVIQSFIESNIRYRYTLGLDQ